MFRTKEIDPTYELPIATLKIVGCITAIYSDDLINVEVIFQECADDIMTSTELLNSLVFIIYTEKSSFISKQIITYLGFNINSSDIKISLTDHQKKAIWISGQTLQNKIKPSPIFAKPSI